MDKSETYAQSDGMKWEPIRKAKRDGIRILIVMPKYGIRIAYWSKVYEMWLADGLNGHVEPTHWMPLPEPPKE